MIDQLISYDVRDKQGWPVGISPESKQWAVNLIREALQAKADDGLTLLQARELLFDTPHPHRPAAFWIARMEKWELAVSYKVLEAVGTKPVWVLRELRKEPGDFDDE